MKHSVLFPGAFIAVVCYVASAAPAPPYAGREGRGLEALSPVETQGCLRAAGRNAAP